MEKVLIAGSSRTPVGIYDGSLKSLGEPALAVAAVRDVLKKTGLEGEDIDEVIIGVAKQTSSPSNCARYISLAADIPEKVPAYTVQCQGASGLQAVLSGFMKIKTGNADVILAGGTESMSQIPYEIHDARYHFGPEKIVMDPIPAMVAGGQPENRYGRLTIQGINEAIAKDYSCTEADQRACCKESLSKALRSKLEEELVPLTVKVKKETQTIKRDELYAYTEGAAGAADGAAVCILVSEKAAKERKLSVVAELVSVGISAGDPKGEGMVGAAAVKRALKKAGKTAKDMDLIEINEITPAQFLAARASLELLEEEREDKVNVYGGALATGNPWAASGVIEINRLLYGLKASGKTWGLALCGAEGGQALAAVIKMRERQEE